MIGRTLRQLTKTRERESILVSLKPKLASLLAAFLFSFPAFLPSLTHSLCFMLDSVQCEVMKGKNMQNTTRCSLSGLGNRTYPYSGNNQHRVTDNKATVRMQKRKMMGWNLCSAEAKLRNQYTECTVFQLCIR